MILIKLLIAHIIGDFFLQSQKSVKDKEKRKLKSSKLYIHVLLHILLTTLILWNLSLWPIILIIGASHLIIDALKLSLQTKTTKRLYFFIDQLLHITVLIACYAYVSEAFLTVNLALDQTHLLLLLCFLFLTNPVSIIMKTIFLKWNISQLVKNNQSLEDAGKYIGILERVLVFIFIVTNHWEAVGFLITAKSVFRFGDLRESKDRQLTEYILIGTLISFGIAIATGLIYNFFS